MTLETSEWDGPFKSKPVQYDGGKPLARRAWRHTWELCTMAVSMAGWYIWWVRSHLGVHPAGTRACLQLPYLSSLSDLSRACPPFLPISFSNTNTNTNTHTNTNKVTCSVDQWNGNFLPSFFMSNYRFQILCVCWRIQFHPWKTNSLEKMEN